jgi:hypothetical protein
VAGSLGGARKFEENFFLGYIIDSVALEYLTYRL